VSGWIAIAVLALLGALPAASRSCALAQEPQPAPSTAGPTQGDGEPLPRNARMCPQAEQVADTGAPLAEFEGSKVELVAKDHPGGAPRVRRYVERDAQGRDVDHGPDRRWYANRQLQLSRTWIHGRQNGPFVEYHENGFEKTRGAFADDDKDGEWLAWHDDGGRPKLAETWKRGQLDGARREWFKSGVQRALSHWKDGVQVGVYRVWMAGGAPSVEGSFAAGRRDGEWSEWMEDGTLESKGRYVAGVEQGEWTRVQRLSKERYVERYVDGQLDGVRTGFDAQGHKIAEGSFARGKAIGVHRAWFANGELRSQLEYQDGKPQGPAKYFHENGRVQSEGAFEAGKRQGRWTYYSDDGAVDAAKTGVYEQDVKQP
jgi:uncharacterized protein